MLNYNYEKNGFDFGDFVITKREILASVSIIAVMLLIGVLISGRISEHQEDEDEIYNKAPKIYDTDIFQYGMETNIGNAFVYGELSAVDAVTYPELDDKYMYVEKIKEKHIKHIHTRVKTYWTWDTIDREDKISSHISFCGIPFDIGKIDIPNAEYIKTIKESSRIRFKYYGVKKQYTGTIFTDLRNKTIPNGTKFYKDKDIEETIERLKSGNWLILFWVFWGMLICIVTYVFYYLDNKWLE